MTGTPINDFYASADAEARRKVRAHYNIPVGDLTYCLEYLRVMHLGGLMDNIDSVPFNVEADRRARQAVLKAEARRIVFPIA